MTLGAMDDLRASVHALAVSTQALEPLAEIGTQAVGFDGEPPIVTGTTIDPLKAEALAGPVAAVHAALAATGDAFAEVEGSGPLGRPIGAVADSVAGAVGDLTQLAGAAEIAMPDVARGPRIAEPKRYLVAALNDAEVVRLRRRPAVRVRGPGGQGIPVGPDLRPARVEAVAQQPADRLGA